MDSYEKNAFEQIKAHRYLIMDALERADDGFDEGRWEQDQFGYAYIQLGRAKCELEALMQKLLVMRKRRITFDGGTYSVPQG